MSACYSIQNRISDASEVFYPSDETYFDDIHHYSESSSILSVCSVEPGTSADVGIIVSVTRVYKYGLNVIYLCLDEHYSTETSSICSERWWSYNEP